MLGLKEAHGAGFVLPTQFVILPVPLMDRVPVVYIAHFIWSPQVPWATIAPGVAVGMGVDSGVTKGVGMMLGSGVGVRKGVVEAVGSGVAVEGTTFSAMPETAVKHKNNRQSKQINRNAIRMDFMVHTPYRKTIS